MKQLPLGLKPDDAPGFDGYVVGANAAAVAQLRALAPGDPPVYLWGGGGAGKTLLLGALAAERRARGERVGAFGASIPAPWPADAGWTLVTIDDCERLDAAQQHAAFALFVESATSGFAIAAAGRVPPVDLPLRDDLRTRLGWGAVFALAAPDEAQVRGVLRREAARRGIALSDGVLDYLMTRFARDLSSLMALLERLDGFSLERKRAVTVPLLKAMLAEEPT